MYATGTQEILCVCVWGEIGEEMNRLSADEGYVNSILEHGKCVDSGVFILTKSESGHMHVTY